MISFKRGASLRLALKFTAAEWADLEPLDSATAVFKTRGGRSFALELDIEPVAQVIYLRADTELWPVGQGGIDIRLIRGDLVSALPELTNLPVSVL